ncbi:hypothetical protein [Variovorax sp. YR216]|uniref:hypothetical protein n=1 Tax=Variovorax sp. YR216 TaxID=1882828 RepID=UPI0008986B85|nr:hypothetical protein [Variovorax sp. YR216]SEB13441.1 hypothetical protein SAMN05444680_1094 [Variovorax sp. YR216]
MTPGHHREKAERIERSLAKLTGSDWEIRIEAAMLAGTHWVNHVLHRVGASEMPEDVVHASMCMVSVLRKYKLAEPEPIARLEEIEELRPLFVRGDMSGGADAADRALALLGSIAERARNLA